MITTEDTEDREGANSYSSSFMTSAPLPKALGALDHSCEEQGAAWEFGDYDVFVDRVCALAVTSHAVERGDAHPGGEISVGTSADGRLLQFPANVFRDFPALSHKALRLRRSAPWAGD